MRSVGSSMVTPRLVQVILEGYQLPLRGTHGIRHWARVLEIGRRIAEPAGAHLAVVELFAVFHDARRINEYTDPDHGQRGAELAAALRGSFFQLDDELFEKLLVACRDHTDERTHPDPTIRACWDSDRLDLGRVGIMPDPSYLGTPAARDPAMIAWAAGRACFDDEPPFVVGEWGLPPAQSRPWR